MGTSHDPQPTPEQQQWLSDRLRAAEREVVAPDHLHAWVRARISEPRTRRWGRTGEWGGTAQPGRSRTRRLRVGTTAVATAVLAAAVAVVAVVLTAGAAAPTVAQAADLALRGANRPAPAPDPRDPADRLAQTVGDLYFPNWDTTLGWHAVGQRTDRLGGRRAVTVYYRSDARTIAYTIVSPPALAQPAVPATETGGLSLRTLTIRARDVVTWREQGKTCILSARGVGAPQLRRLAGWTSDGSATAARLPAAAAASLTAPGSAAGAPGAAAW